jgi:hypothetical protein
MKIKINSIACDDLPKYYLQNGWFKPGELLENNFVGQELDVYAVTQGNICRYWILPYAEARYLWSYPAALTEVIDCSIPASWVVSHENPLMNRKLPEHQTVFCPAEWLRPFFSMFVDRLHDECEDEVRIFSGSRRKANKGSGSI